MLIAKCTIQCSACDLELARNKLYITLPSGCYCTHAEFSLSSPAQHFLVLAKLQSVDHEALQTYLQSLYLQHKEWNISIDLEVEPAYIVQNVYYPDSMLNVEYEKLLVPLTESKKAEPEPNEVIGRFRSFDMDFDDF